MEIRKKEKQAGFAEPHSSSTIGWVAVGLVLGWVREGFWFGKQIWIQKQTSVRKQIWEQNKIWEQKKIWVRKKNNATPSA